jgi:sugar phosphate isomerase/epimerase
MATSSTRSVRTVLILAIAALTLSLFAIPATAKPGHGHGQGCHRVPDRKIGVQLWTVRSALAVSVPDTLEAVADAGYRNVEPFSFHGYTAEEFSALLDQYGLRAPSMHTNVDALANDLDQVIADADAIGARFVTLAFVGDEWRTEEGVAELADILNAAGRTLRRNGLQLAYHNHDFEFTTVFSDGRTMYETLADSTNRRLVKLQLDLYWAVTGGVDPVDVIEEYGNRIVTFHVKDRAEDGSFADVGEGTIDFAEIFDVRPVRYYFVENDQPDDPIDSINDSYRNLRKICY